MQVTIFVMYTEVQKVQKIREKNCRNFRIFLFVATAVHGVCRNPLRFRIKVWVKIIASK